MDYYKRQEKFNSIIGALIDSRETNVTMICETIFQQVQIGYTSTRRRLKQMAAVGAISWDGVSDMITLGEVGSND